MVLINNVNGPEHMESVGNLAENWRGWEDNFRDFIVVSNLMEREPHKRVATLRYYLGNFGKDALRGISFTSEEIDDLEVHLIKLRDFFAPQQNVIAERHKFWCSFQEPGQDYSSYIHELKIKAKTCMFFNDEVQDEMIRDKIVTSIRNKDLQKKFLLKKKLSLQEAIDMCIAEEQADKQMRSMTRCVKDEDINVDKISKIKKKREAQSTNNVICKKCGEKHPWGFQNCKKDSYVAEKFQCYNCQRTGHIAKYCPLRQVHNLGEQQPDEAEEEEPEEMQTSSIDVIEDDVGDILYVEELKFSDDTKKCYREKIWINGKMVRFKLDPGSEANCLNKRTFLDIGGKMDNVQQTRSRLVHYGADTVQPFGVVTLSCQIRKKMFEIKFYIVDDKHTNILGINMCEEAGLIIRVLEVNEVMDKEDVVMDHSKLFKGIGCIKMEHTITMRSDAKPIQMPAYRISEHLEQRVNKEIDKLVKLDIIEELKEPSEWVSNLVIIDKPDGGIRLCIDSRNINKGIVGYKHKLNTANEIFSRMPNAKLFSKLDATKGFYQIPLSEESKKIDSISYTKGDLLFQKASVQN